MKIDSDFRGIIFIGSRIATSYSHNHRNKKSPEKKSSDEINKKEKKTHEIKLNDLRFVFFVW